MIKKLMRSVREYKRASILTPLFVGMEVIVECIIPFVTAKLIEQIQNGCEMSVIVKHGLMLVALAFASLSFGALSGYFCAIASSGFAKNLRHDLYAAIQGFSFQNVDKFSTSGLVTRTTTDVTNLEISYMMIIRTAVRCPMMLIFALVMAIITSAQLSVAFAVIIPFLAIGLFFIIRAAWWIFDDVFRRYDALNNSVQENVSGMRVVKSFVRENYEKEKFGKASDDVCRDFTRAEKLLALNSPLMQICLNAVMIVVMLFGSRIIISSGGKALHVGQLSALLTYGFQILMSLMMLSMIIVTIAISIASAKRVCEVLDEKSAITSPEPALCEVADGSIEFSNVSFRYSAEAEKAALANINLSIRSGETIGIIGGTGSSKSTLVQLIPRLYDATEGQVKVGGHDVRDYELSALRNAVSMVLQKNLLFSGTIRDNLRWGDENASDEELERICRLAQADEFIRALPDGYDTHIEQGGTNVSGGQKQRLCIARALLKKPKILILDDSTSAVDTKTDALIRKAFAEEIPNTTKIIIAQRIGSVEHADRILVMDNGTISACGTHEELLASSDIYREVYESQTKGGQSDEQ
ncbi:MAG: ABC transporter ATP-binding protein [Ruminococcaceae bacterium]|nr:ABC transporter ATP-binding protein [Oscillospiraceae bacterium]